jgi:hypothetical protein
MYTTRSSFSEDAVDRSFLETVRQYREGLPPSQRDAIGNAHSLLLPRRRSLSPDSCLQLMNLLWDHQGTLLEEGYHIKEGLKRLLETQDADEQAALCRLLQAQSGAVANTPLSQVLSML